MQGRLASFAHVKTPYPPDMMKRALGMQSELSAIFKNSRHLPGVAKAVEAIFAILAIHHAMQGRLVCLANVKPPYPPDMMEDSRKFRDRIGAPKPTEGSSSAYTSKDGIEKFELRVQLCPPPWFYNIHEVWLIGRVKGVWVIHCVPSPKALKAKKSVANQVFFYERDHFVAVLKKNQGVDVYLDLVEDKQTGIVYLESYGFYFERALVPAGAWTKHDHPSVWVKKNGIGTPFSDNLEDCKGEAKIAAGALLPHDIIESCLNHETEEEKTVAELQRKRMVDDMLKKGKLTNCIAVSDVSGSMEGIPMEVSVALGLLVSELSEEPWKGHIITFSDYPQLHLIEGNSHLEKSEFIRKMDWGNRTDFQMVFDEILKVAVAAKLSENQMIRTVFVFSDMEFNEASENLWETDYTVIQKKFKKNGYERVPNIVFLNLRNSSATPVTDTENGVAMLIKITTPASSVSDNSQHDNKSSWKEYGKSFDCLRIKIPSLILKEFQRTLRYSNDTFDISLNRYAI
ncbi:hypothetical protein POM88_043489 [Heracleum sosnowskyi]|uniref:Uncharacterized protein n=1 Tax=Heracleum sosnowskyi TaxID=360622 RepID=A0AAD8H158_9APIA|nr:hypothetical protein POM88_043489 [Heracleum sosnowskyi]